MQTSGTIELAGTRTASIELAAGNHLNNVLLSKTGTGSLMLSTDLTLNNLTINSGTMMLNHHSLSVNGNVSITGGAFNAAYSDDIVYVNGNWTNSMVPLLMVRLFRVRSVLSMRLPVPVLESRTLFRWFPAASSMDAVLVPANSIVPLVCI